MPEQVNGDREPAKTGLLINGANLRRKVCLMQKWISVKVGLPNSEIPCVVAQRSMNTISVYPKFVENDGTEWVDIDGEAVTGVVAWQKAPQYDLRLEETLSKIAGCVNNDKCENKECCYFVTLDLFEALLEYIK